MWLWFYIVDHKNSPYQLFRREIPVEGRGGLVVAYDWRCTQFCECFESWWWSTGSGGPGLFLRPPWSVSTPESIQTWRPIKTSKGRLEGENVQSRSADEVADNPSCFQTTLFSFPSGCSLTRSLDQRHTLSFKPRERKSAPKETVSSQSQVIRRGKALITEWIYFNFFNTITICAPNTAMTLHRRYFDFLALE